MDMMTNEVVVDLLTNTPFVGFLIWQYVQMRKDYKQQEDKLEARRIESLAREEEIRGRFEKVISQLNQDRDDLVKGLETRLVAVESKMEIISSQVKKLFSIISKLNHRSDA